jgi:hypothetical protein
MANARPPRPPPMMAIVIDLQDESEGEEEDIIVKDYGSVEELGGGTSTYICTVCPTSSVNC